MLAAPPVRLARVELEEVDRLGGIRIGFRPRLADFVNHHSREFVLPLPQQRGCLEKDSGAGADRLPFPRLERLCRSLDRLLDVRFRSLLERSDDLVLVRGVQRVECRQAGDALPADDQRMRAAQLTFHFLQSRFHCRLVLGPAEVSQRLVAELGECPGLALLFGDGCHW